MRTNPVDVADDPLMHLLAALLQHLRGDPAARSEYTDGFADGVAASIGAVVLVAVPQTAGVYLEHGWEVFQAWYDLHAGSPDQRDQ